MSDTNKDVVGKKISKYYYEVPMEIYYYYSSRSMCGKILAWKEVMSVVIYWIHFIRKNGLGHFQGFFEEIESEHGCVIYFTEVRWSSR